MELISMLSLDERKKYKKSMIRLSSLKDVDYSNLSKFDTPICTAVEVPLCIDFMRVLESLDIAFIFRAPTHLCLPPPFFTLPYSFMPIFCVSIHRWGLQVLYFYLF